MVMIADEDARRDWSQLLDRVERGEEVWIVRDGRPSVRMVADLPRQQSPEQVRSLLDEMEASRQRLVRDGRAFSTQEILEVIREGRQ